MYIVGFEWEVTQMKLLNKTKQKSFSYKNLLKPLLRLFHYMMFI